MNSVTNDKQLDRIERMLKEYLRSSRRKSWKQDERIRALLELQRKRAEALKRDTESKESGSTSE